MTPTVRIRVRIYNLLNNTILGRVSPYSKKLTNNSTRKTLLHLYGVLVKMKNTHDVNLTYNWH